MGLQRGHLNSRDVVDTIEDPAADYARSGESSGARLDRNYGELLQELCVVQAGVQILFAFLLAMPSSSDSPN